MLKVKFTLTKEDLPEFTSEQIARIRHDMVQNMANGYLEGWEPTADEIKLLELAAFKKINHDEFMRRSLALVGLKR
ncbi:hypothetical protein LJC24_01570 [Desulfococcaceae bacterium OttesenSCG-928-F15]|nr:hypothetical protein [Desulfococcaceae bacterium OttesenSCG-928-F15]